MAKKVDVTNALCVDKKEFQCVEMKEPFHTWNIRKVWDGKDLKSHGLQLAAVEVKATEVTGAQDSQSITRNKPLELACGIKITSGRSATTQQSRTARFSIRVDSVTELNQAMQELSKIYGFKSWWVKKLEIFNTSQNAKLYYEIHSPNGVDRSLFLKHVETPEYSREFQLINLYDQQLLCNSFYERFASCSMERHEEMKPTCAIEKRKQSSRMVRTPQSGYKRKHSHVTT